MIALAFVRAMKVAHRQHSDPFDVESLRNAAFTNQDGDIRNWFVANGFSKDNQGESITTVECEMRNELINLLVDTVKKRYDEAFCIMLEYVCHSSVLYHARNIDDKLLAHVVLSRGSVASLGHLINSGYDVNHVDMEGMTPLLYIIYRRSVSKVKAFPEKLKILLECGAGVNMQGTHNWQFAPLHITVLYNCGADTANTLLEAGADVNLQCQNSQSTPLFLAVERGSEEMVDLFLENEADVSIPDVIGDTPLHAVVLSQAKSSPLLRLFIKWNVSLDVKNTNGQTPLILALTNLAEVKKSRIQLLLKAGAECSQTVWKSIRNEHIKVIKSLKDLQKLSDIESMLETYAFTPKCLQDIVCFRIRGILGRDLQRHLPLLPLPDCLKRRVQLHHLSGSISTERM